MREIRFDPDFWPRLHETMNDPHSTTKVFKNGCQWTNKTEFLKSVAKLLTQLSIEDVDKLKYDFDTYPFYHDKRTDPNIVRYEWRCANIPIKDIGVLATFYWRFNGTPYDVIYIKSCWSLEYPKDQ